MEFTDCVFHQPQGPGGLNKKASLLINTVLEAYLGSGGLEAWKNEEFHKVPHLGHYYIL